MSYIIIAAIGLLLVLEGILPFIAPNFWRHMVITMAKQSNNALRITGLVLMLVGLGILFLAHMLY